MSLILTEQPGFSEIPNSTFGPGQPVTSEGMTALNTATKFAVVRTEEFWGFYKHGETVALPVSSADGYAYERSELMYVWSVYWSGSAPGTALGGTHDLPARGATGGAGHLLQTGYFVNPETGVVSCAASYHKDGGSQTDTDDGILLVTTLAKRQR